MVVQVEQIGLISVRFLTTLFTFLNKVERCPWQTRLFKILNVLTVYWLSTGFISMPIFFYIVTTGPTLCFWTTNEIHVCIISPKRIIVIEQSLVKNNDPFWCLLIIKSLNTSKMFMLLEKWFSDKTQISEKSSKSSLRERESNFYTCQTFSLVYIYTPYRTTALFWSKPC